MDRPGGIRDIGGMQLIATTLPSGYVALMGALLPAAAADEVPEWVHLLPASAGRIDTQDARGPYFVRDAAAIIAESFQRADRLPIDENHATDLAAPEGRAAPARGWITGMEARADGIWGRVEWTRAGRELLADHAYRGISPVILHGDDKAVRGILRASLVNNPNLRGLTALHQEGPVSFTKRLAEKLGLNAEASEDDILAALPAKGGAAAALQSALPQIAEGLGLEKDAGVEAVLAAARTAGRDAQTVVPTLQAQVTTLSAELKAMKDEGRKQKAGAFVDGAIRAGRMGINAQNRDEFAAMHMENPERTEKLVNGFAVMTAVTHAAGVPPQAAALGTADDIVGRARALQAAEKAKGIELGWTDAVLKVSEGKS